MLMPEPHASEHARYVAAYRDTGVRRAMGGARELRAKRRDGSTFPVILYLSETVHEGQRAFMAFLKDQSGLRMQEQRAHVSELTLSAVFDSGAWKLRVNTFELWDFAD